MCGMQKIKFTRALKLNYKLYYKCKSNEIRSMHAQCIIVWFITMVYLN